MIRTEEAREQQLRDIDAYKELVDCVNTKVRKRVPCPNRPFGIVPDCTLCAHYLYLKSQDGTMTDSWVL